MSRARNTNSGSVSGRRSVMPSSHDSSSSGPAATSTGVAAEELAGALDPKQELLRVGTMQRKLREAVLRRDQVCVVTGCFDLSRLQTTHVLTPEYIRFWSKSFQNRLQFSGEPNRLGRGWSYDVSAACMPLTIRSSFLYTNKQTTRSHLITSVRSQPRIFIFHNQELDGVRHGEPISLPRTPPITGSNYLSTIFPPAPILNEHFRQAFLRKARGAAEALPDEHSDEEEEEVGGLGLSVAEAREAVLELGRKVVERKGFVGTPLEVHNAIVERGAEALIAAQAEGF
ncbi:hypothetical protein BDK51DRAFT_42157 [Blyttiomyces helicus]|uniref:Uncharacterized protein n=1 Tax=Blyttiomyces helicus TaxID=388810 RepID=A0A4P9WR42_9FUNG|nr:hypothetical protein BDK51DRAFT_42157 [Blyttiomyces helicus]|eukprot:RKO94308.1 hypothetical protein BDK51DRAFT_42157 [Blyttiomyces helicus]